MCTGQICFRYLQCASDIAGAFRTSIYCNIFDTTIEYNIDIRMNIPLRHGKIGRRIERHRRVLLDSQEKQETIRKKSLVREYVEAFAIAILLALFIRTFIVQAFKIPSGSMKPTLLIGDHLLVNKFIYGIKIPYLDRVVIPVKEPKRGDVIVFKWPKDESKDFIKRVIGVEGDVVEIKDNQLFINSEGITTEHIGEFNDEDLYVEELEEYLGDVKHSILDREKGYEDFGPITVPENSVFVMGDNRDNSQDGRYWGYVTLNKIKGKALIIYWSWPHWNRFLKIIR